MTTKTTLTVLALLSLLAAPLAAQAKKVDATFKIGTGTCTHEMTLDSGATGEGATELTRADAKNCGLLDAAGDPVMTYFEPDPSDPTKPKKKSFGVADGSSEDYALTKPIEICVEDSKGNECCASIRITVICDKTKTGSNLLGKEWLKKVKAIWDFEDDALKWPKDAPAEGDKKSKTLVPVPSGASSRDYDAFDQFRVHQAGQSVDVPAVASGLPFTLVPQSVLAALPPVPLVDVVDLGLPGDDSIDLLLKNGFVDPNTGPLFDVLVIDALELVTDQGPVLLEQQPVLVNPSPFDLVVLGTDVLGDHEGVVDTETDTIVIGLPPLDFPWTRVPGSGKQGSNTAVPDLVGVGTLLPGDPAEFILTNGLPGAATTFVIGLTDIGAPFKGGVLVPSPDVLLPLNLDPLGGTSLPFLTPPGLGGLELHTQAWLSDAGVSQNLSATKGVTLVFQ